MSSFFRRVQCDSGIIASSCDMMSCDSGIMPSSCDMMSCDSGIMPSSYDMMSCDSDIMGAYSGIMSSYSDMMSCDSGIMPASCDIMSCDSDIMVAYSGIMVAYSGIMLSSCGILGIEWLALASFIFAMGSDNSFKGRRWDVIEWTDFSARTFEMTGGNRGNVLKNISKLILFPYICSPKVLFKKKYCIGSFAAKRDVNTKKIKKWLKKSPAM